jgi:hypothetical protein
MRKFAPFSTCCLLYDEQAMLGVSIFFAGLLLLKGAQAVDRLVAEFFTLSKPVWVGDLGTRK